MKDHPSQWIQSGLTCREVTERVSVYLDDRLPVMTKFRIGIHLASCVHCRTYVKQIGTVGEAVALLPSRCPTSDRRERLIRHFARCYAPSP